MSDRRCAVTSRRPAAAALRAYVALVWAGDDAGCTPGAGAVVARERMLPTGLMHVVFRLSDDALRILPGDGHPQGQTLRGAMLGGARSRSHEREFSGPPACSVGALLRPGAAQALFGVDADALSECHTPLEDVLGAAAARLRDRLGETPHAAQRLQVLEAFLAARLSPPRPPNPAVAALWCRHPPAATVAQAVRASGLSHRHFIAQFRRAVGLAPKPYLRVARFQQALGAIRSRRADAPSWAELALQLGYCDQAHFNRDFAAFAGMAPGAYRRLAPRDANHLPLSPPAPA